MSGNEEQKKNTGFMDSLKDRNWSELLSRRNVAIGAGVAMAATSDETSLWGRVKGFIKGAILGVAGHWLLNKFKLPSKKETGAEAPNQAPQAKTGNDKQVEEKKNEKATEENKTNYDELFEEEGKGTETKSVDDELVPGQGKPSHLRAEAEKEVDKAYATLQKAMKGDGDLLAAQEKHQRALDRFEASEANSVSSAPTANGNPVNEADKGISA